jgi:biopolymer transport protein ExbD
MIKMDNDKGSDDGHLNLPFLVPMLDMVLILLFFFIMMSNTAQNVFDIKLPSPDKAYSKAYTPPKETILKVTIKADSFYINETPISKYEEFTAKMIEQIANTEGGKEALRITVASDKQVEVQSFLKVMTFLKNQGLEKVDIIMGSN